MAELTWKGGTGNWFDASNWTPAQVPQSGDTATITSGTAQLTSNPADDVTLNLSNLSNSSSVLLDATNVTFGPQFNIVDDTPNFPPAGPAFVGFTGSVVDQGTISVGSAAALGLIADTTNAVFTNQGYINTTNSFFIRGNFVNAGQLNISGGPSSIQNSSMTGTGSVNISSFGGIAILSSTVGSGQTFNFLDGERDQLALNPTTFSATISGFQSGNQIHSFTAIDGETYNPANHVLSLTNGGQPAGSLIIAGPLSYTTQSFFISNNTITTDVPCFCRGTRILTRQGEVEVENLTVGDEVMTVSGVLRPVVFVGRTRAREVQPILVHRGALGDDIPHRDLYVSPGHALFLSEVLVRAESLVNGRSIVQCDAVEEVEYHHVELPAHDVLFAEGAAAESYLDDNNRDMFENTGTTDRSRSGPAPAPETYAPLVEEGPALRAIWRALAGRAGIATTSDPDLRLVVDGNLIRPISTEGLLYKFHVARLPAELHIVSRTGIPAKLGINRDSRQLGIALSEIIIRQDGVTTNIRSDAGILGKGFHYAEDGWRWTNGDARVPLPRYESEARIELHLRHLLEYYPLTPVRAERVPVERAESASASAASSVLGLVGAPRSFRRRCRLTSPAILPTSLRSGDARPGPNARTSIWATVF